MAIASETISNWQDELKDSIRTLQHLLDFVGLSEEDIERLPGTSQSTFYDWNFPVFVTKSFARRIRNGAADDPLLRQVLPHFDEPQRNNLTTITIDGGDLVPGEVDPVGDNNATQAPGVLQKYHGRSLLISTGACAIHCRYCFRQNYHYSDAPKSITQWQSSLRHIEENNSIREVIFSGGDPWTLPDKKLSELVDLVDEIDHVKTLRFHTRLPIVLPSRVNDHLLNLISSRSSQVVIVIHANHVNELEDTVARAIGELRKTGALLLNQSVLLAGVNDSVEDQYDLCSKLIEIGVMPYYLHQLDNVIGSERFHVSVEKGIAIIDQLRDLLPGYALPRYVVERPGESSKTPIR